MRHSRLKELETYIIQNDTVSLEDIAKKFRISMSTIRRDVNKLLENGNIYKVYGGVTSIKKTAVAPYLQRSEKRHDAKEAIAKAAARLISNNDVIFIDSGTTTYRLISYIDPNISVTLITASVSAVISAYNMPNVRLICLPGELERDTNSFCSVETVSFLSSYNINKAFLAAVGVSGNGDITNSLTLEHDIKLKAMEKSNENILLADSSKHGEVSLFSYAQLESFDKVITDSDCSDDFRKLCEKEKVLLIAVSY